MNPILDLRLHAPDSSRVALQMTYTPADATATSDLLATPLTLALDPALDPVAYGHALTAALLPAPAAAAFARARADDGSRAEALAALAAAPAAESLFHPLR